MSDIKISDHALLRYIERVHGVNIELIKEQMSQGINQEIVNFAGGNKINVTTNECKFIIEDGVVKTVLI